MANSFKEILSEASGMFDIAARMAEEEASEPERREVVMAGLMELAKSCRGLMMAAKERAEK